MKLSKTLQIASVLLVAVIAFAIFAPGTAYASPDEPSIVDIALAVNADEGEFSTLIAALVYTDLVGALDGNRQFTVFAPTDAAFENLGLNAGNIATEFAGEEGKAALTNILLYHVSPGERFSDDVLSSSRIRTMNKSFIFVSGLTIVDTNPMTADANLVLDLVDIDARNGVIHVIDQVLLP